MDKKLKILNSQQFLDKMLMGFFLNGNIFLSLVLIRLSV